ncbi:uncharacterized protein V1510DRAFT_415744 [Dipodascopsis tothii]|uniref:uncharacterized protein n=1 Tax=Dipodascopsis tothii TaxID=44089 RepID=UPI0034CD1B00
MSYTGGYTGGYGGGYSGGFGGGYGGGDTYGGGFGGSQGNSENKFNSPGGGDRTVSEAKARLRPVTIKQILEATQAHPDAEYMIDGSEVATITFVGIIRNILNQTTNSTYRIEDGTETCEIKKFIPTDKRDSERAETQTIGMYVRVIGEIKSFNNKRYIQSNIMRPVTDFNEVTHHQMHALYVHLLNTRGPAAGAAVKPAGTENVPAAKSYASENLTVLQMKVMDTLVASQESLSNDGLHVNLIAGRVGAGVEAVTKACEDLAELGLLFTTIDYFHYKLT